MQNIWNIENKSLLERLKKDVLSGPTLARPHSSRRFYIKTDCSKDVLREVFLQAYDSEESRKSDGKENDRGKCEFDKSIEGMRLRPMYFISRSKVPPLENSRHSFVG